MVPQPPPPLQEVDGTPHRPPPGQDHPPPLQCFPPCDEDQDDEDDEDGGESKREVEKMADLSHRVKGEANKQAVRIPTCPLSEYEEKFIFIDIRFEPLIEILFRPLIRPDVDRVYGDHFLPARHFVLHPLRLWFGDGDFGEKRF